MNYFQPWTSDEGPEVPEGWGLEAFRGRIEPYPCDGCKKRIGFKEEYMYKYTPEGVRIIHNTKECWDKFNEGS